MERALAKVLFHMDFMRGLLLKKTLRVSFFRELFTNRALRLSVLFLLACLIYLPLSLFFPVWVAVVGPIIYGVPHIIASFRYSQVESVPSTRSLFIGVWTLVTIYRVVTDLGFWSHVKFVSDVDIELLSFVLTLLVFGGIRRSSGFELLKSLALVMALLLSAWYLPLEFSAFLLLFHNAVAFIYWIARTRPGVERAVALTCTFVFLALTAAILAGSFEFLYKIFSPQGFIARFNFGYEELGQVLVPHSGNYRVWFNFFVAYVFGQSLHYFVWLKAIPEQHLPSQTPVSFRISYEWLVRDFGRKVLAILLISVVSTLAMWLVFNMNEARIIYFAIASYHGFHELAGLPWMKFRA